MDQLFPLRVPNALPGHDTPELEIFGMEGVPPEDLQRHWDDLPIVEYTKKARSDPSTIFTSQITAVNASSVEPLILSPLSAPVPPQFPLSPLPAPVPFQPVNNPIITANPTVYPFVAASPPMPPPPMMMNMHYSGYPPPYGYPYPPTGYPISGYPPPFYPTVGFYPPSAHPPQVPINPSGNHPTTAAGDVNRKDETDRKRPLGRILIEGGWDERLGKAIPGMQIYAADLDISPVIILKSLFIFLFRRKCGLNLHSIA